MRKNSQKRQIIVIGFTILVLIILLIFYPFQNHVWDVNAEKLSDSFNMISGNAVIDDLTQFTPFEWDTLYSFRPYTPIDEIYKVIGYRWDTIIQTVSEGMNQIVFTKNGKVVCYLYGYPSRNKLSFDLGQYDSTHIMLKADKPLPFETTVSVEGVRYLKYIGESH